MRSRFSTLAALVVLTLAGVAPTEPRVAAASPMPASAVAPRPTSGTGAVPLPGSKAIGTRVDPAIGAVLGFRARTGRTAPGYRRSERLERDGVLPVVIRFSSPPSTERIAALARAGVAWERAGLPMLSGAYAAKIDAAALAALDASPDVSHVECDLPRDAPRPLDASARETGIASARRALRAKDGTLLDGTGVKIADIDSGLCVFHPAFFRADGGVHAWVDVDGDGKLTPGVDGVDLDGSGTIEPGERLNVIEADAPSTGSGVHADIDYLYLDLDGNGRRDFGASFGDATPAFGEPIFVIDDVDGDGVLAPSEKLLRLGTSKIVAARTSRTYERGNPKSGISRYGQSLVDDEQLLEYASHGTGAAGILVAGVPDRSRYLGLAPGAELVVVGYGDRDPTGTTASVQWAIDQKVDVILTEYAPYTGFPLDGSSEEEQLLDAAVDAGVVVVNPAGNLSIGYKHQSLRIEAGSQSIPMKTDASFAKGPYVAISLLHRGDPRTLDLNLKLADGMEIPIPADSTGDFVPLDSDRWLNVVRRTSARGTHEIHIQLYAFKGSTTLPLPEGNYALEVTADAAFDAEVYVGDAYNSWARGFVLEENTPTRTLCHPATSDKGIAVAAYALHDEGAWGAPGQLAAYSSMGPRLDGEPGIEIAAPDNPWSATVPSASAIDQVRFEQFGGTSGAGPHVAAAAALVKQLAPSKTALEIKDLLLKTARRDSFVTADATKWGKGKLDVARALGLDAPLGAPPKVTLVAPEKAQIGRPFDVKVLIEDDEATSLKARWDLEYDGAPDTEWETPSPKTITADALGDRFVRVDVLDRDGNLRGATAKIAIVTELPSDGPISPAADAPGDDGGCGCGVAGRASRSGWLAALALAGTFVRRRRRFAPLRP